jgi:hypothetical protein
MKKSGARFTRAQRGGSGGRADSAPQLTYDSLKLTVTVITTGTGTPLSSVGV